MTCSGTAVGACKLVKHAICSRRLGWALTSGFIVHVRVRRTVKPKSAATMLEDEAQDSAASDEEEVYVVVDLPEYGGVNLFDQPGALEIKDILGPEPELTLQGKRLFKGQLEDPVRTCLVIDDTITPGTMESHIWAVNKVLTFTEVTPPAPPSAAEAPAATAEETDAPMEQINGRGREERGRQEDSGRTDRSGTEEESEPTPMEQDVDVGAAVHAGVPTMVYEI